MSNSGDVGREQRKTQRNYDKLLGNLSCRNIHTGNDWVYTAEKAVDGQFM